MVIQPRTQIRLKQLKGKFATAPNNSKLTKQDKSSGEANIFGVKVSDNLQRTS